MKYICLILLFAACSIIPEPRTDIKKYYFETAQIKACNTQLPYVLLIDTPSIHSILSTNRIVVYIPPAEIEFLSGVEWADKLELLIKDSLVYSFNDGGLFKDVQSSGPDSTIGDYLIKAEIRKLGLRQDLNKKYTLQMIYQIEIFKLPIREKIAGKIFEQNIAINNQAEINQKLNLKHKEILENIYFWVYEAIRKKS